MRLHEPPRIAMRWRADMIEGLGKKGEQLIIVLDIGRVFATDDALRRSCRSIGLFALVTPMADGRVATILSGTRSSS